MKIFVTSRFRNVAQEREDIERLCSAVRSAGHEDFSFIRDVEHFEPQHFQTQAEVWSESLKCLKECDALLIDVSDAPSGGRNVEVGMAYALRLPVYVIVKKGVEYKSFYGGIAASIVEYENYEDLTAALTKI